MPEHRRVTRDQYHLYFDAQEEPRITVDPGETIVVETEDAHLGTIRDESTVYQSLPEVFEKLGGANPVSGPIYVEGVEPGDVVTMEIVDMVPGSVQGQGYTVLTPGLGGLVSDYTLQEALTPRTVMVPIRDGTAYFPAGDREIPIPTAPFLGTIGLAPGGERRLSYFQGLEWLGNVDLPNLGIGTKVHMRANVAGGLVSVGDAHALQGDGEISGAAVECQSDVTVRFDRIPKTEAAYVGLCQMETETTVGSIAAFGGVHLGDVVRAAYVDMVRRLEQFHGFSMADAYQLLCLTARVTVGQVVDPLYSATVEIDKSYLDASKT